MVNSDDKTFRCELIGPMGKLLDCRTTSVIFPAHDGQVGVLYDHMPMLSQLGLGVLRVVQPSNGGCEASARPAEVSFFVDGGFALVAENSVTVVAYDALALQGVQSRTIESMVDQAARNRASPALSPAQQAHEDERWRALRRIVESVTS
jgi:F-type H+-transporting ATPase subunit epsilon